MEKKYHLQMQWQMECCNRQYCDFVSFDPRMPPETQIFVERVYRDDAITEEIRGGVVEFLGELAEQIAALRALGGDDATPACPSAMPDAELQQGTHAWLAARCGSLGASAVHEAIAKNRSGGWGASRKNLMARLTAERLTGVPQDTFQNAAMQWGTDKEPRARALYSVLNDVDVEEVGLIRHPTIAGTHASPDGLVGDDGMVEIKCPNTATHIQTLLSAST